MKAALTAVTFVLLTVSLSAGDPNGIPPRPKPADHQAQATLDGFDAAASCLTRVAVAREFASDLNRGYVVIEVAIYPAQGKSVEIDPARVFLRVTEDSEPVRAAEPRTMARSLQKATAGDRDIAVYPSIGVGYETARYDPSTGQTRPGGWTTDVGVGVGVGSGGSGGTDEDRKVIELELKEKGLPKGKVSAPVSGYVYFPAPQATVTSVVLDLTVGGQTTKLTLPRK